MKNENKFGIKEWFLIILAILLVIAICYIIWIKYSPKETINTPVTIPSPTSSSTLTSLKGEKIKVDTPQTNAKVESPLITSGQVKGNWSFEASFPIILMDANGKVLSQIPATLSDDWMTTDYVPFKAELTFQTPSTSTGKLILKKDNPSGNSELDDQIGIPIKFY